MGSRIYADIGGEMKIVFDADEAKATGYSEIEFQEFSQFTFNQQLVIDQPETFMAFSLSINGKCARVTVAK
jgi:hypothetical protein